MLGLPSICRMGQDCLNQEWLLDYENDITNSSSTYLGIARGATIG